MKTIIDKFVAMLVMAILTLAASAASTLTITEENQSPLRAGNFHYDAVTGLRHVPMARFRATANGGNATLTVLQVNVYGGSLQPNGVYLYDGANLVSSSSDSMGSTVNIYCDLVIPNGTTKSLTVVADFPAPAATDPKVATLEVSDGSYQNDAGVQCSVFPSADTPLRGPRQHFYDVAAVWVLASAPTINSTVAGGNTTQMVATFSYNLTAIGGDVAMPQAGDFTAVATINGVDRYVLTNVSVTTVPNSPIADGATSTVSVTAVLPASQITRPGLCGFSMWKINWAPVSGTAVEQYWGHEDEVTASRRYFYRSSSSTVDHLPDVGYDFWQDVEYVREGGEWNYPGQVVSEGGLVFVNADLPDPVKYIFAPRVHTADDSVWEMFIGVGATVTASDIAPRAFDGSKFTSADQWFSDNPPNQYTLTNVTTSRDGNGVAQTVRFSFDVDGLTVFGKAIRIGNSSCFLQYYWGSGASSDSPGSSLDCLDLSASRQPVDAAEKNLKPYPPRFQFGMTVLPKTSQTLSSYRMTFDTMPGAIDLQASSDMVNWTSFGAVVTAISDNPDGSFHASISLNASTITSLGLDPNKVFFRLHIP